MVGKISIYFIPFLRLHSLAAKTRPMNEFTDIYSLFVMHLPKTNENVAVVNRLRMLWSWPFWISNEIRLIELTSNSFV